MATKYSVTSPDGVNLYDGGSRRRAEREARDYARVGWIGSSVVIRRDGERICAYVVGSKRHPVKVA